MEETPKKPLGLYIHIPFCVCKCLYCDFLSFAAPAGTHEAYVRQLIRELQLAASCLKGYALSTVFIGGGTPSAIRAELIEEIMEAVWHLFPASGDVEATIEVNPGTLISRKLAIYKSAGLNRVSIGLQSADNRELKSLGRIHSFEDFLKAFQGARMAGFSNINVDIMSALPGQDEASWRYTLKKVTMLKPEHISAYSLILEEGTPFWERYGPGSDGQGDFAPLPDEETEFRLYEMTRQILSSAGYGRYEISNYAKPGFECRHNIGYWKTTPYLGVGLGAASYLDGCRFSNTTDIKTYLELNFTPANQEEFDETTGILHGSIRSLTRKEEMEEFMFLGLRLCRGISEIDFMTRFSVKLDSVYGPVLRRLTGAGLIKRQGMSVCLTQRGMDVSNRVLSEFLLD